MNEENNIKNDLEGKEKKKKAKKEKKPETIKTILVKRMIFIVIFFLIALSITIYFVKANSPIKDKENTELVAIDEPEEKNEEKEFVRNHVPVINLDEDTFSYNSLTINEIDENYEGLDIKYYQISGLKDSNIENSINNMLKQDLENAIDENLQNGNIKNGEFDNYNYIYANFSNVISLTYYITSSVHNPGSNGENDYYWSKTIGENFDLNTGERIKLQELFTDDTLGSDIFDNKFYSSMVPAYVDRKDILEDGYWSGYESVEDYNDIEDEILKLVLDFNNGKDIGFYFNEQWVTIAGHGTIYFEDHLDFIALYDRFKSNSDIFLESYQVAKNLPILVKRYSADYQIVEESNNYYLDININKAKSYYWSEENEKDEAIYEVINNSAMKYINNEIDELKKEEIASGKFNIYNYFYTIGKANTQVWDNTTKTYHNIKNETYVISYTKAKRETTKSIFDSEIKPKITNIFRSYPRNETGDVPLYGNLFYDKLYGYSEEERKQMEEDWEISDGIIYLDKDGNIYQTEEEAWETTTWGTRD